MAGKKPSPFVNECTLEKTLIKDYHTLKLYEIGWSELSKYTQFVYDVYAKSFTDEQPWELTPEDLITMNHEDQTYFPHSAYLAFMNNRNQIIGTMKVTQKTNLVLLPTEVEYRVNLRQLAEHFNTTRSNIWHAGRLAVNKSLLKKTAFHFPSRRMFLELVYHTFSHITQHPDAIFLAEADKRIVNLFRQLGINMQQVAQGKMYLGSETYPVVITHSDMLTWMKSYKANTKAAA